MVTTNTVLRRGEAPFNQVGQSLPSSLHDTDQQISAGLVKRLQRYAEQRLADSGLDIAGWDCEVYTMDADDEPANRFYCVEFINSKGGRIGVQGILTGRGWPQLDHGLTIAEAR